MQDLLLCTLAGVLSEGGGLFKDENNPLKTIPNGDPIIFALCM